MESDLAIDAQLQMMLEQLSSIEHERWSHWQKYMHSKGVVQPDGSLTIPAQLIQHWERLISTPYNELTEKEKESDREQVRRYLPLIAKGLTRQV